MNDLSLLLSPPLRQRPVCNGLRKDPSRTNLAFHVWARELRYTFRIIKAEIMEFVFKQNTLGFNYNPDEPRDEDGKWTAVDIGKRDTSVSTGTGKATSKEEEMIRKWKEHIAEEAKKIKDRLRTLRNAVKIGGLDSASDEQKLKAFEQLLKRTFDRLENEDVVKAHTDETYKTAARRQYTKERPSSLPAEGVTGAVKEFMRSSLGGGKTQRQMNALGEHAFELIKSMSAQAKSKLKQIVIKGMSENRTVTQVAKMIAKQLKIAEYNALRIARTELVAVAATAQLDTISALGGTEVGVDVEWVTAAGSGASEATMDVMKVCPRCQVMSGKVFKIKDAYGMIPLHPNCRCTWYSVQ